MCAVNVPQAHAGEWEIVQPESGSIYNPDYAEWLAEVTELYPGNIVRKTAWPPDNNPNGQPVLKDSTRPLAPGYIYWYAEGSGITSHFQPYAESLGGAASASYQGTPKVKLRYVQDTVTNADGVQVPDVKDVPTGKFYLKVTAFAAAASRDASQPGQVRNPAKESVSVSVSAVGDAIPLTNQSVNTSNTVNRKYLYRSRTFLVPVEPQGQLTKTVDVVAFNVKGALSANRFTTINNGGYGPPSIWNQGYAQFWVQFNTGVTPYKVRVSSDIEPSWKKHEGELPDEYKKRVQVGNTWPLQPDPDKAQLASPPNASPQIWRVKCQPDANGTMTVERRATMNLGTAPDGEATIFWYGGGTFTAHTPGMTSPNLQWDVNANIDAYNGNPLVLVDHPSYIPFGPKTLNLGTGKDLPTTSTTVNVTATDSVVPALTLSGSYTVNWHEPLENIYTSGSLIKTYSIAPATVANTSFEVADPGESIDVWVHPATLKATVLLSSGESAFVAFGSVAAGTVLGLPTTWAANWGTAVDIGYTAAAWACMKAGYKVVKQQGEAQDEITSITNTEGEWQKAIQSTKDSIAGDSSADIRVTPVDVAYHTSNEWDYPLSSMRAAVKVTTTRTPQKADGYDEHGYRGVVPTAIDVDTTEVVGVYVYSGAPPTR